MSSFGDVVGRETGRAGLVVALGGGTLESPDAAELLAQKGGVVFLDVEPEEAWKRVKGSDRPLARDRQEFQALLARRRDTYERCSDLVLSAGARTVDDLARDIAAIVRDAGDRWGTLWGRRLGSTQRSSLVVGGANALELLESRALRARENGSRLYLITDANVMRAWGERVLGLLGEHDSDAALVVEPGEASKSVVKLEQCWNWLAACRARRDDIVVALGGGVVGDLAGFVAATYQRGISLWQVPTSLLAQVDSSVGGKTAVDLGAGKNLVGAFYQPDLVVADPVTLTTLPPKEYSGGLGEVVKHALLMSPADFARLEADASAVMARDLDVVGDIVRSNVAYKAGVVDKDEREKGRRAVLNLGHTTAHALEVVEGYGSLGHGYAVALGLLVSLAVSERLLGLDCSVRERTKSLLEEFALPTSIRLPATVDLLTAAGRDKKVSAASRGFVGLRQIGDPVWGLDVPDAVLAEALEVIDQ